MTGKRPGHDLARKFAAVVIENHIENLRADPRPLSRRALRTCAPKQAADIAESGCPERRPAEQPRAEDAERDCYRKLALDAGKGRTRKRHDAAANLDRAREHNRVGCAKHLQQRVKKNNSDDAGDQCGHSSNIVTSGAKSMAILPAQGTVKRTASLALAA